MLIMKVTINTIKGKGLLLIIRGLLLDRYTITKRSLRIGSSWKKKLNQSILTKSSWESSRRAIATAAVLGALHLPAPRRADSQIFTEQLSPMKCLALKCSRSIMTCLTSDYPPNRMMIPLSRVNLHSITCLSPSSPLKRLLTFRVLWANIFMVIPIHNKMWVFKTTTINRIQAVLEAVGAITWMETLSYTQAICPNSQTELTNNIKQVKYREQDYQMVAWLSTDRAINPCLI
jgi:hypothetical protein